MLPKTKNKKQKQSQENNPVFTTYKMLRITFNQRSKRSVYLKLQKPDKVEKYTEMKRASYDHGVEQLRLINMSRLRHFIDKVNAILSHFQWHFFPMIFFIDIKAILVCMWNQKTPNSQGHLEQKNRAGVIIEKGIGIKIAWC